MFDVAVNLLLVEVDSGREVRRQETRLFATGLLARAAEFVSLGAGILICGAISAPLEAKLIASGVQVIGFTCGTVNDVLAAYLSGELEGQAFVMPGYLRRRNGSNRVATPPAAENRSMKWTGK